MDDSKEALNIIKDMMEEQIINTVDLTRTMIRSLQFLQGQVCESRDNIHYLDGQGQEQHPAPACDEEHKMVPATGNNSLNRK